MYISVFKPLKQKYDETIIKWQRKNYGKKLPKSVFSAIISEVWKELNSDIIKSGFCKSGIYPFCNSVISEDKFEIEGLNRFNHCHFSASTSSLDEQFLNTCGLDNIAQECENKNEEGIQNKNGVQKEAGTSGLVEISFEKILLEHV